jgi:UDP-N-acetylmuramoyl-tripeptide--D-alanyl-D-alanine ligase
MKKIARKIVAAILGYQVRKLYKKNNFKVIGVVGSIGKTSTKLAIAKVLESGLRVRYQDGNYNDLVTVPLVFFGEELPSLFNPLAWLKVFWRNAKQLRTNYSFDAVVIELGSDAAGQIREFKRFLKLEIAVVTGLTAEHMQSFKSIDSVAKEELTVSEFSSLILINKDLSESKYYENLSSCLTYSLRSAADFNLLSAGIEPAGLSQAEQYSRISAAAVAEKIGFDQNQIKNGLKNIQPAAGRMRILKGVNGSTIIDDTYNSSPAAAELALNYLYRVEAPQKIAVLGSMNEMGGYSQQAHEQVGSYCDPKELSLVVTIGADSEKYLAPAAEAKGCKVHSFDNPYTAGEYLKPVIKKGAAVLVKGSQNGVFAEETVKVILADSKDSDKLVRQSTDWDAIKKKVFKR